MYALRAANAGKVAEIEREHSVHSDSRISQDRLQYGVYKAHGVTLRLASQYDVIKCLEAIWSVIDKLGTGRANNALESCYPVRSTRMSSIDCFIENRPRDGYRKDLQPLLFLVSIGMMLISRVEERKKEPRVNKNALHSEILVIIRFIVSSIAIPRSTLTAADQESSLAHPLVVLVHHVNSRPFVQGHRLFNLGLQ